MPQHTSGPRPLTSDVVRDAATTADSSAGVAGGCPVSPLGYDAPPVPLGPESLTWRYFGDWRGMLQGPFAGSMQNMHPQLGAAVEQHSTFFREPLPRVMRSLYPIGGVVFDGDRAPTTGAEVRDYHTDIKGVDDQGRRYHALNPDVFYWAHSTFFMGTILVAERFGGGLTEAEKRQLFDEHIQWYRMYGMSMRPVPKTWEEFQVYWDHMCRNVLEDNYATRAVLDLTIYDKLPIAPWLPDWLWGGLTKLSRPFFVWLTVGFYHPAVRERLGFQWTGRDEWLHRRFGNMVRLIFAVVPPRYRKHPRARAGLDRASGRIPADAPLPQTPARNLPPLDKRGDPMHYCPRV
ncbi:oxygenase MpaB family protein [Mycobacterium sp. 852014-52450_SCH5900713]|uniref:oxygenase MpaB family protein n=1 Tax=Mycobacterium sp. 852014-52450_SCH5900713 TaxID=1834116 RepID=UPI0009EEBB77